MKRFIVLFLSVVAVSSGLLIKAETLHQYYPGGKNYINLENITVQGNVMELTEDIKIKPSTTYTLSFPDMDHLGELQYVYIYGANEDYLEEYPYDSDECYFDSDYDYCTFTTSSTETSLNFIIQAEDLGIYYDWYLDELFQLEEGAIQTEYEEYVEPYIDSESPLFTGSGGYITSYSDITLLEDIIDTHIMVMDAVDGDLSDSIIIENNEYTGNEQVVGKYDVDLSVTDMSNNTAYFKLVIMVKDEIPPIITSDEDIYLNVEDGIVLSELFGNQILIYDEYDLFPIITVLSNQFSTNEEIVGVYLLEFKVSDSSENQTIKQVQIHVEDYDSPIITSDLSFITLVDDGVLLSTMLEQLIITDNYDNNPTYRIISDDYTSNEKKTGIYPVVVEVSDFSGNTNQYTMSITVYDDLGPSIEGPSTISFSYEENKSLDDILGLLEVSDNYSQLDISDLVVITDTYTNRDSTIGDYQIIVEVSDESGNKDTKEIAITLYDDVIPVIFIDEHIIVIEKGSTFDQFDALLLLKHNKVIEEKEYDIKIIVNEYEGNEDIPGEYKYQIELSDKNGSVITKDFVIKVDDHEIVKPNYIRYGVVSGFMLLFSGFVYIKIKK